MANFKVGEKAYLSKFSNGESVTVVFENIEGGLLKNAFYIVERASGQTMPIPAERQDEYLSRTKPPKKGGFLTALPLRKDETK